MTNTPFEVPGDLREFAQKSVEQARKAFEGFVSVAQKTADAVDSAQANVRANVKSVSSQTLGYAEQNINAAFDFANKLVQAKDLQEAFALQSEFLKSQLANMQSQAKEIGSAMQTQAKEMGSAIQNSAMPKSE